MLYRRVTVVALASLGLHHTTTVETQMKERGAFKMTENRDVHTMDVLTVEVIAAQTAAPLPCWIEALLRPNKKLIVFTTWPLLLASMHLLMQYDN